MKKEKEEILTDRDAQRGMEIIRDWVARHPDRDSYVVVSVSGKDSWSPMTILRTLEERIANDTLGHDDIPEMILKSISESGE